MQWVDAMRGFSMILVVFSHVSMCMGQTTDDSVLCAILQSFRMPLFFFVSGFFSYRALDWWTRGRISDILSRKVKAQIFSAILFTSMYQLFTMGGVNLTFGLGRYWFTIALFQMYLAYLLLSVFSRALKKDIVIPALIIISLTLIGVLSVYRNSSAWAWNFFSWIHISHYMQFFTLGIICSRYRQQFTSLLCNNKFITTMIIGWAVCQYLQFNESLIDPIPFGRVIACRELLRFFALFTVISMFYGARDYYQENTQCSRALKAIGRRTLDIYFLHFFFLPDLHFMTPWFAGNRMLIVQLFTTLTVSLAIVALCMLISSVIRRSATLANVLFGERIKRTSQPCA